MPEVQITWLGHASLRIDTPGGKRVYVDPYLENPKCPEKENQPERIDILALTHGHSDHAGSALDLIRQFSPAVVAQVEVQNWLGRNGADIGEIPGINKGGTREIDGIGFTMTDARHSSAGDDGEYLGESAGFVLTCENGTRIYIAGDTSVFMDMQLIGRIYEPDLAILPIGDHFTMGPREAAVALELLAVERCMPYHYGTFPILSGTPDELRQLTKVELLVPEPGETITV
ncbi:MAG: metal-dependent hydrolase [Actinobacteria bacterium]|nr:metal-dependent hydrolase [Actinomycetota bacterium]